MEYNGFYRGEVKDHKDPLVKGRVKIFVPGVYPSEFESKPDSLPWSEPVMSLFGGSANSNGSTADPDYIRFTETGVSSTPHVGAHVWVFFERGDHNEPRHFGVCQGGSGWLSAHKNQHVVQTNNVRICVDEDPTRIVEPVDGEINTNHLTYNNANCTHISREREESSSARVAITIEHSGECAIDLNIVGNINMHVVGDMYLEQDGDRHETILGDIYRKHKGDLHLEHVGDVLHEQTGNTVIEQKGNWTMLQDGDNKQQCTGDKRTIVSKELYQTVGDNANYNFMSNVNNTHIGMINNIIGGSVYNVVTGEYNNVLGSFKSTVGDNINFIMAKGNVDIQAFGNISTGCMGNRNEVVGGNSSVTVVGNKIEEVTGQTTIASTTGILISAPAGLKTTTASDAGTVVIIPKA